MKSFAYLTAALSLVGVSGCFDVDRVPGGPPVGYETDIFSCEDGRDNDQDGLIDCQDPDCIGRNFCGEVVPDLPTNGFEGDLRTCIDLVDNDLDGQFDCGDRGCQQIRELCCVTEFSDVACSDGIDNDGNGFADCQDFACRNNPFVQICRTERICDDGIDNDGDRRVDCDDRDCASDVACMERACDDGLDNDGDLLVDCGDSDCVSDPACRGEVGPENTTSRCVDGEDNDDNGFVDCREFGCCNRDGVCIDATVQEYCDNRPRENSVETCTNDIDDDGNGFKDCVEFSCCRDGVCISPEVQAYCDTRVEATFELCTNGIDDDGNGFTDCDDFSCSQSPDERLRTRCEASYESCRNGVDDDGDGFTDCSDRSCEGVREFRDFIDPETGETVSVNASPCNESLYTPRDVMDDPDMEDALRRQARVLCSDGIDSDGDGFVDCDDWDCQWNPLLNPRATDRTTEQRGHCQGWAFNTSTRQWLPLEGSMFSVETLLCQ